MIHSLLGAATILLVAAKRQPTLHREQGFLAEHCAIKRKYRALRRSRAAKLPHARPTAT